MASQTYTPVTASEIVERAQQYCQNGYRLIQIHCTKTAEEMFIIYTFEKIDLTCESIKMNVETGVTIPSISGIFFSAFLYENEIHDLYGVNFSDMAVDFKGTFYETSVKHPFNISGADDNKE